MKDIFIGVVQWANSVSCFPVASIIRARGNKPRREVSKVPSNENQREPLPTVRPRPLTPPLQGDSQQQTKDQSQSIFFKLPYEIRFQIYELVLGAKQGSNIGKVLHILPRHYFDDSRRLSHVRCYHKDLRPGTIERNGWQHDCWLPWRPPHHNCERLQTVLALSKTCRRMYV
jgi:hypothetical protein